MKSIEKLSNLTLNITDGKHGDCTNEKNSGYYFVSSKDIYNGYLNLDNARQITIKDYEETHKRTKLEPNDILITNSGTIGKICFIKATSKTNNITFQKSVAIIKPNSRKVIPKYLYYNFSYIANLLIRRSVGSNQKNLLLSDLRDLNIQYYKDKKVQQKIADYLSIIDNKIELNNKINDELEQMARNLFNYWFVQFDFPNEEGKPYKTSGGGMKYNEVLKREIPKGWEVENIASSKITKIINTGIDEYIGTKIYLSTSEVKETEIINHTITESFKNRPSRANMQPITNSIWFARMKDSKKIILISDFSKEIVNEYIFSTGFAGLKVPGFSLYYIWNFINSNYFEKMKDLNATGSTQKAIINESIENIPLLIPTKKILEEYNSNVMHLYMLIYKNQRQYLELTQLRNFLLPLLMNGQVKVN